VYHVQHPLTTYPIVQGHEICGTVAEVGSAVQELVLGDTVVLMTQATAV
jgi:L-iditol 2-dehydrogenase